MSRPPSVEAQPSFFGAVAAIPRRERPVALRSALFFFGLMASYYMVRSLRDAVGASRPDELRFLFLGTFAMTLAIQPAFGWLVKKFDRRAILPSAYRGLALLTLAFGAAFALTDGEALRWTQRLFFCWTSSYLLVGVSLFWGMLADVLGRERSLRLFGPIAVGGTVGAIAGSQLAARFAEFAQRHEAFPPALSFAIVGGLLLEGCVRLSRGIDRAADDLPAGEGADRRDERPLSGGVMSGFRRVGSSPYLLLACVYVVIYVFGSTLLYRVGSEITNEAFGDDANGVIAFFARVDTWVNVATLFFQLFAARVILERVGVGVALAVVPLVGVVGFSAVALAPTLSVLVIFSVARRSTEYGISKPGRDALFTVVSPEDKYKSKLVIDTVVYRGGDAAALWLVHALVGAEVATAPVSWGLAGLAGLGVIVSLVLGARFAQRAAG